MNIALRGLSFAYAVMIVVLFQLPTSGTDVWWSIPARFVLTIISCLPALAAFLNGWVQKRPFTAMAMAAALAGHFFFSFVGIVLIGASPGRGGVGVMRALLVLMVLEVPLIFCWCVAWFRSIR